MLVLHGLFGNLGNWGWQSGKLAEHCAVFAVDLRNHGSSPHNPTMDYPLMAGDVAGFIVEHDLGPCHLLGHSMGGKVAMQLALQQPDLVRKLLVVDIAPVAYDREADGHLNVFSAMAALDLESLKSRAEAEQLMRGAIPDEETRQFVLSDLRRGDDGKFRWRMNVPALRNNYENLRANVSAPGQFHGETLFVKGGSSDYILAQHRDEILARFPHAKSKTILNAGHWVHAQKPQAFLSLAQQFFLDENTA